MDLDAKHQVLFAIYSEYLKDEPRMSSVTYQALQMEKRVFNIALAKLDNEQLITGACYIPPNSVGGESEVLIAAVFPSMRGIEYVEKKLEIANAQTGQEKLRALKERFGKLGWDVLQEFVVNIITQLVG